MTDDWPKTEPLVTIDYNDYRSPAAEVVRVPARTAPPPVAAAPPPVIAIARPAPAPAPPRIHPRAPSPTTVIPVPKLPRIEHGRSLEPVVSAPRRESRSRIARGTGPQPAAPPPRTTIGVRPPPPIRPAEDDRTTPGIALPRTARPVMVPPLPSIVRRSPTQG